jgi:heptosyltransferase-2
MKSPSKILVIRFSSIGDLVLTSPVFRVLKAKHPNTAIHLATKAKLKSVLLDNPNIDQFQLLEGNIWSLAFQLRKENYDYIIDLHNNLRSLILKLILLKPFSAVKKMNLTKWRMVNLKHKLKVPHIVDRYMEACRPLGVRNDGLGLQFYTDQISQKWIKDFLISDPRPYSVFAIGGQFYTKRLPIDKWHELGCKYDQRIIIIGGKEDIKASQKLLALGNGKFENLCGQLSINQSAEIIRHSLKLFTNDTGMMHIGAAFNREIEVFWGNTLPEFGMYPYYPTKSSSCFESKQVLNLACRPCSKIGFKECPQGHFKCMSEQIV